MAAVVNPVHAAEMTGTLMPLNSDTAFGRPRNFLGNRFVYAVISPRARGLSIGINLTPDKRCNFDCAYCEVSRDVPGPADRIDVPAFAAELTRLLNLVRQNRLRELPWFSDLPPELLELKEVTLSGDGEPTLCADFTAVLADVAGLRARWRMPFKIVLITNTTGLDLPEVRRGLRLLTRLDEVWVKLDAGTQGYMNQVNRPDISLEQVVGNILSLARERPVVVQSLFPLLDGCGPSEDEIEAYAQRLLELKTAGAEISLVQVYSSHRPPHRPNCRHLPLKDLSLIARRVREVTGLRAEVF